MFVRVIVASLNKLRLRSRRDEGEKRKMETKETERGGGRGDIYTMCIIINRPGANRGTAESERTIRKRQRTQERVERPRESI